MKLPIVAQAQFDIRSDGYLSNPYLGSQETALVAALVRSVAARVMVEFGVQNGRTARMLLRNVLSLEAYIAIDVPPAYRPTLAHQRSEIPREPGLYAQADPRFELIIRERGSLDLGPQDLPRCDAAFIDGDHSEGAVRHDSELARAVLQPGGVIIWHDYDNPGVEVTPVLNGLYTEGWPISAIEGTWLAFMRT